MEIISLYDINRDSIFQAYIEYDRAKDLYTIKIDTDYYQLAGPIWLNIFLQALNYRILG